MQPSTLTINNTAISTSSTGLGTVPGSHLAAAEELLRGLTGWENTAEKVRAQALLEREQVHALTDTFEQFQTIPSTTNRAQYENLLNNAVTKAKTHRDYCLGQKQQHQALLKEEQAKAIKSPSYFTQFGKLVVNGMRYLVNEKRATQAEDFLLTSDHLERIEAYQKEALRQQRFIDALEENIKQLNSAVEDEDAQKSTPPLESANQLPGRHLLSDNNTVTVINPAPDQLIEPNVPYHYCLDGNAIFSGNSTILLGMTANLSPSWLTDQGIGQYEAIGAWGISVQNDIAFLAPGQAGLHIININDPSNPQTINVYKNSEEILRVTAKGDLIVTGNAFSGLTILNISNPNTPMLINEYNTQGYVHHIFLNNENHAFIADAWMGIHILDISNPYNPILVGTYSALTDARYILPRNNSAFIADWTSGIHILDISNLNSPTLISNYDTLGGARALALKDNTLFVADSFEGITILDVANLANPTLINIYDTPGETYFISIQDNTAFIADGNSGLLVLDITDTYTPRLLGTYNTPAKALEVFLSGNKIFLTDSSLGLIIKDLSKICLTGTPLASDAETITFTLSSIGSYQTPTSSATTHFALTVNPPPQHISRALLTQSLFPGDFLRLRLDSDILFENDKSTPLRLSVNSNNQIRNAPWLDITQTPAPIDQYQTPSELWSIFLVDNTAFLADGWSGLQILDISDEKNPQLIGSFDTLHRTEDIIVQADIAYLADGFLGLQILSLANIQAPTLIGSYNDPAGWSHNLFLQNNILLIADGAAGLQIIDVTTPSNPTQMANYATPNDAQDVIAYNNIAVIAAQSSGLHFVDISDPNNPGQVTVFNTPGSAERLFLENNRLFATDNTGLLIINIENPQSPTLIHHYTQDRVSSVFVENPLVFLGLENTGIDIVDLSDINNPNIIGHYDTPDYTHNIVVKDKKMLVADNLSGLHTASLTNWELTLSPNATQTGNHLIHITATDRFGASDSTAFLTRVEGPPQFTAQIPPQYAKVDEVFNYFIPEGLVVDPNFDTPSFSATAQGQNVLLPWLSFNGISATFAGTPGAEHVGPHNISVVVTDNIPGTPVITQNFALFVSHKPTLANSILDQKIDLGTNATFSLLPSAGTQDEPYFTHLDGLPLTYSLLTEVALPTWLSFGANPPVFFIDARGMTSSASYRATLIVNDNQQGSIRTSFDFVVDHFPPVLKQPISNQVAAVGSQYSFAVSLDTFYDPNNPVLYYDARQSNGESLPGWLHFDPNSLLFSGEPGPGDTNTYADRILNLRVSATDQSSTAYADFELRVNGSSWIESFIYVAAPTVSTFGTLFGLYKKRSLLLNRCNKDKYQKLTQTVNSGEMFVYPLETERKSVHKLQAKRRRPLSACMRLFRSPRMKLEGELRLPEWMQYNRSLNRLESKELVPNNIPTENLTIQIKGSGNVILEQFELNIQGAEFKEDTAALPDQQDGDIELAEMRRVSHS